MDNAPKFIIPKYIKFFFVLANIVLALYIVVIGNFIISPLIAAMLIAILLRPLENKINKFGIPRILSASITVMLFVLAVVMLLTFLTAQLSYIADDPGLSGEEFNKIVSAAENGIANWFHLTPSEESKLAATHSTPNLIKNLIAFIPGLLNSAANYLSMILLFFVGLFFFLYYRAFLINFIYKLFSEATRPRIQKTIERIKDAVNNYIVGLFFVILIVSTLNSIGLLILGVNHAIIFGVFGAILTIIPYIGILIGALLPALYAFMTTGSLLFGLSVVFVFSFVQFLEGNFITPNIVGSKENINPFIAILGLFVGGALLGSVGVILAIPLLGIIKIICDDFQFLKPIGYVLGNPNHNNFRLLQFFKGLFNK